MCSNIEQYDNELLMIQKKLEFKNIKKEYQQNGFIVLRKIIDLNTIKKINKSLNYFIKNYKPKNPIFLNYAKNKKINSIHDMDKWVWTKKLKKNKIIKKIVKTLINEKFKSFGSELFAKPAKVGLRSPIHQDNFYWCINNNKGLTIWFALSQSNKKNGGVYYFKGSHNIGLLSHRPSNAPGSSQTISDLKNLKKFKKIYSNLNPGDCLIHNVMVAHGSNKNNSSIPRKGLTIRFVPKKSKFNKTQKKIYKDSLKIQLINRKLENYAWV